MKMLDKEYKDSLSSKDQRRPIHISKLAIIEYCGWIEVTIDEIIGSYAKGKLKTVDFQTILKDKIKSNYGFNYEKNIRPLLIQVIGTIRCEKFEHLLNRNGELQILISELNTILVHRNKAAHTYIKDAQQQYPSPSVIIRSFETVYPILKLLYKMRKNSIFK